MDRLFIICILILSFPGITSLAQTYIAGGNVSGIWDVAKSPYLITENIIIPNDSTLIIEPGVKVEFQGHYSINVQGRLLAIGTETDSILFTVNDTTGFSLPDTTLGGWYGIRFLDTPMNNDSSKLVYCRLEYGKAVAPLWHLYAGGAICILQFGKILISNCLIQNNFSGSTSKIGEQAIAGGLYFFKSDIIIKNTSFINNRSYGGGAIYFDESNPVFENNTFENNSAFDGGAISIGGKSYPSFKNDKFLNNFAENQGGGLSFVAPAILTCSNTTLSGNIARFGGGIGSWAGELNADNCLFLDNHASEWGGGVAGDMARLTLTNCTFSRDTSDWGSGGLHIYNSEATVSNCIFSDNRAEFGGGLYFSISDITLNDNTFLNNQSNSGGAINFENTNPIFKNNTFTCNFAEAGGAISMVGDNHPTFTGDKFENNEASNHGGGIMFWETSNVKCNNVEFTGNKAQWGAGIGVWGGELHADNCLFSDNHASIWGGGLASDFGILAISNCTFAKDTSDWGSGGLHMDHVDATIANCTFEENKAVFGGGFHTVFSQVNCIQNDFLNNTADVGGGIHMEESESTIDKCRFIGNRALNGEGGAIDYTADSTIFGRSYKFTVRETNFTENTASVRCGAIHIEQFNPDFSLVDLVLDSCRFYKNHSNAFGTFRIIGPFEDFVVSNSLFSGNTAEHSTGGPGFSNKAKGEVNNCVFYSNYSVFTDSTKNAHGVTLQTEAKVDFINCTFADTSSAVGIGLNLRRGAFANVSNCILWNTGDRPVSVITAAGLGATANINYCDIENGKDSVYVSDSLSAINWGDGNLAEDPLFIDIANADLHLKDISPCIGSGKGSFILNNEWITSPVWDIEGNPRPTPLGTEVDIGAYEHILGAPLKTGYYADFLPSEFKLFKNYPNPFNKKTVFNYELSIPCKVDLTIHNIYGQKVTTLVSEKQSAGFYEITWNAGNLNGGHYIYRLQTNKGFVKSGKLTLLK